MEMNNDAGWMFMIQVLSGAFPRGTDLRPLAGQFAQSVGVVSKTPRVHYIVEKK
jgi:hypothetical protein